jgi:hypothetical protein
MDTVIILSGQFRGHVATKVGDKIKLDNGLLMAESVKAVEWDDCETAARQCNCCGEGMDQGYVYNDDSYICEACLQSGELDGKLSDEGYESSEFEVDGEIVYMTALEKAFDDNYIYWTEWTMDDFDYVVSRGELIELIR